MVTTKVTCDKSDNLDTIREKLISLIGKQVLSTESQRKSYKIFDVGEVEETVIGKGVCKAGSTIQVYPMWGFYYIYGQDNGNGKRWNRKDLLMIQKESDYKSDIMKNTIIIDEHHPFIFINKNS
jgi:hypothetical protein